jgi:hypothetical protein
MTNIKNKYLKVILLMPLFLVVLGSHVPNTVYAADGPCKPGSITVNCSDPSLDCSSGTSCKAVCNSGGQNCDFVKQYVNPGIKLFSIAFGLVATISIIIGGINYSTSGGDPQKASKARARITNTVIALVAYMFLYALLQFLIPGGAFK